MMGVDTGVASGARRRSMNSMTEINITSFVDVVLVLLIIFMMTSQFLQAGFEVDLPNAATPALEAKKEPIIVSLDKDRRLKVGDVEVTGPDGLGPAIERARTKSGSQSVYLNADRTIPYGAIVRVMESIKAAGIQDVGLMTEPGREDWFER